MEGIELKASVREKFLPDANEGGFVAADSCFFKLA